MYVSRIWTRNTIPLRLCNLVAARRRLRFRLARSRRCASESPSAQESPSNFCKYRSPFSFVRSHIPPPSLQLPSAAVSKATHGLANERPCLQVLPVRIYEAIDQA